MHYIQGDSVGKINILGCDCIGHCGEKFQKLFSSQCIIYRVIQEAKSIFWDVIVSVIVGEKSSNAFLLTMHYIQGDSGGKINILGCDCIGHCGEKISNAFLLTMHYIQGDSGGKINILGCDCIGHCGEKSSETFLLTLPYIQGDSGAKMYIFGRD